MYAAFYGLERDPFGLTPDPRFLHLAEPHRNTLKNMLEGVSNRKGLQVSLGPIGTGKTTLLYCLQHILAHESTLERPLRSAFIVNPVLTADELFETLFEELEIKPGATTKPGRLRAFHELLLECYRRGGAVVVIVDEAHLLPHPLLEELRLLLNLDNYPTNVLQMILCGQPELGHLLMRPEAAALKGRLAVVSKLRPLTLMECRTYVAERLHIAGLRGENPFTTPALEEIFRLTQGVPRLVNIYCDRALNAGFKRQSSKIVREMITEVVDDLSLFDMFDEASAVVNSHPAGSRSMIDTRTRISGTPNMRLAGKDE